jgi:hypothetical protein
MTLSSIDATREYKNISCAGRRCRNIPTVGLRIRYVNKTGSFCKSCADDLLRLGVAEPLDGCGSHDETDCHSGGR